MQTTIRQLAIDSVLRDDGSVDTFSDSSEKPTDREDADFDFLTLQRTPWRKFLQDPQLQLHHVPPEEAAAGRSAATPRVAPATRLLGSCSTVCG